MTRNPPATALPDNSPGAVVLFGHLGKRSAVATAVGRGSKAVGFSLRAGADFVLLRLTLRLSVPPGAQPVVRLCSSQAGQPQHELATLQNPVFGAGLLDSIFLPSQTIVLAGGHSYWVVASNTGNNDYGWYGGVPPGGLPGPVHADALGWLVSSGQSWGPSNTHNALLVIGRPVDAQAQAQQDEPGHAARQSPPGGDEGLFWPDRPARADGLTGWLTRGLALWRRWRGRRP